MANLATGGEQRLGLGDLGVSVLCELADFAGQFLWSVLEPIHGPFDLLGVLRVSVADLFVSNAVEPAALVAWAPSGGIGCEGRAGALLAPCCGAPCSPCRQERSWYRFGSNRLAHSKQTEARRDTGSPECWGSGCLPRIRRGQAERSRWCRESWCQLPHDFAPVPQSRPHSRC